MFPLSSVVLLTDTRRSDCQTSSASCLNRNAVKSRTLTAISTRVSTVRRLPSGRNVTLCSPIGDPVAHGAKAQVTVGRGGGADGEERPKQRGRRCGRGQSQ